MNEPTPEQMAAWRSVNVTDPFPIEYLDMSPEGIPMDYRYRQQEQVKADAEAKSAGTGLGLPLLIGGGLVLLFLLKKK